MKKEMFKFKSWVRASLALLWQGCFVAALLMVAPCLADVSDEGEDPFAQRNMAILSGELSPGFLREEPLFNEEFLFDDEGMPFSEKDFLSMRVMSKGNTFLFHRLNEPGYQPQQDLTESHKVFNILLSKALSRILFDATKLWPFDHGGTCTAMALDFLARYLNECKRMTNEEEITLHITNFRPYYQFSTSTFMSRQAAYNTITIPDSEGLNSEDLKYRKMQSLANYHNIKLTPVTGSIKHADILFGRVDFKKIIQDLPLGSYVIRALSPTNNHKQEVYGHTMILIKKKDFSIFFDNSEGAAKITEEPVRGDDPAIQMGEYIENAMIDWWIPEYRVYRASSGRGGCKHLSTEKT